MAGRILMHKEVASWLVDNTSLTFSQIAEFCGMHPLEVQALADRDAGEYALGFSPVLSGILTWDDIHRCEADDHARLEVNKKLDSFIKEASKVKSRYTPLAHRQNRPDAILYLVKNHPELTDAQICRLVHTTKATVASIRDRTHRSIADLEPKNPVTLEICSELELQTALETANAKLARKSGAPQDEE